MKRNLSWHPSVAFWAGLLIFVMALLAGGNLWLLRRLYQETMHTATAQSVLDLGQLIARQLADQPSVHTALTGDAAWDSFARLVRSIHEVEPGLSYVSVTEEGEILYHEQMGAGLGTAPSMEPAVHSLPEVNVGRRVLGVTTGTVPVLTFTVPVSNGEGPKRSVQIAIRRDVVEREETAAAAALGIMFRVSLATILGSFGISALLVILIIRRDRVHRERRQQAEHLAFAGALADGVFHDLRNPMSALRLDVQMLQKEAGSGSAARAGRIVELAERARHTVERMDGVLQEFLYISRPDAREPEAIELNGCVKDCLDLVRPRFEQAGIPLHLNLADTPLPIRGYAVTLKRAVVNVLTNARDASPQGKPVTVTLSVRDQAVRLTVEDEGPGIPGEAREKIFEMFFSLRPGGTGLGLHLARTAVERSGGRIYAENRAGGGARIVIEIPYAAA